MRSLIDIQREKKEKKQKEKKKKENKKKNNYKDIYFIINYNKL
jgi:hypothetical protein